MTETWTARDSVAIRCAYSAYTRLGLDIETVRAELVGADAAARIRVNVQRDSGCVIIAGTPADLRALSDALVAPARSWGTPQEKRAASVTANRITRELFKQ